MTRIRSFIFLSVCYLAACGPAQTPVALPAPPPTDAPPVVASMDPPLPRAGAALRQVMGELGRGDDVLPVYLAAALTGDPAAVELLLRGLGDDSTCPSAALALGFLPRPMARRPLWVALRTECGGAHALVAAQLLGEHELAIHAVDVGDTSCASLAGAVATGMAPDLAALLAHQSERGTCAAEDEAMVDLALAVAGEGLATTRLMRRTRGDPTWPLPRVARHVFGSQELGELDAWAAETLATAADTPETAWAAAAAAHRPGGELLADVARLAEGAALPGCREEASPDATRPPWGCHVALFALAALARHPGELPELRGLESMGYRLPAAPAELSDPRVLAAAIRLRRGDEVVRVSLDLALGSPGEPPAGLATFLREFHLGAVSERLGRWSAAAEGDVCAALVEAGRLEAVDEALLSPREVRRCLQPAARAFAERDHDGATVALRRIAAVPSAPGSLTAALELRRRELPPPRWARDPFEVGRALTALVGPFVGRPTSGSDGAPPSPELRAAVLALCGVEDETPAPGPPTLLLRDIRTALPSSRGQARSVLARLAFGDAPSRLVLERLEAPERPAAQEAASLAIPALRDALLRRGRPADLAARALLEPGQSPAAGAPLLRGEAAGEVLPLLVALCDRRCPGPLAEVIDDPAASAQARRLATLVLSSRWTEGSGEVLEASAASTASAPELALWRWVASGLEGDGPSGEGPRRAALARLAAGEGARPALGALLEAELEPAPLRRTSPSLADGCSGAPLRAAEAPDRDRSLLQAIEALAPSGEPAARVPWAIHALARLAARAPSPVSESAASALRQLVEALPSDSPLRPGAPPADLLAAAAGRDRPGARAQALAGLAIWRRAEDVELITAAQSDGDARVRRAAARALTSMPTLAPDHALAEAVSDPDPEVRLAAFEAALARGRLPLAARVASQDLGQPLATLVDAAPAWTRPALRSAASSEHPLDRATAAVGICRARAGDHLGALARLLGDDEEEVRVAAAAAYHGLVIARPVEVADVRRLGITGEDLPQLPAPPEPLPLDRALIARGLSDSSQEVRFHTASALVRGDRDVDVALLIPLLTDDTPALADLAAAGVLAARLDETDLPALEEGLGSSSAGRRVLLAAALSIEDLGAADLVVRALRRPSERGDALAACALRGPTDAASELTARIGPAVARAAAAELRRRPTGGAPEAAADHARAAAARWILARGADGLGSSSPAAARALLRDLQERPRPYLEAVPDLVERLALGQLASRQLEAARAGALEALRGPATPGPSLEGSASP